MPGASTDIEATMLAKRAATNGSPVSAKRRRNDVAKTSPAPVGSTSLRGRGGTCVASPFW